MVSVLRVVLVSVLTAGLVLIVAVLVERRRRGAEARLSAVLQRTRKVLAVTENSAAARRLSSVLRQTHEALASIRRIEGGGWWWRDQ